MNTFREPKFLFTPMTEKDAQAICAWTYDPPYHRYQWEPWEVQVSKGRDIADPALRFTRYRSVSLNGELCGFVQWFPMASSFEGGTIRLGLGLKPSICGAGLGVFFARSAARDAAGAHPRAEIDLEVAADNVRAAKAYLRAGFIIEDQYELIHGGKPEEVLCMVWSEAQNHENDLQ